MNGDKIKLGMGQMLVEGGNPEENLDSAVKMIKQASEQGCAIIVLPECLDLGWTYPEAEKMALSIPGRYSDILCDIAKKENIYVAAGLTEKEDNKVFNTALLISEEGNIILKHRKISILDIAKDIYKRGNSLKIVDTPFGKIGINICADNFPDNLFLGHSLGFMGADLLLSPSAWAVKADYNNIEEPYGKMWEQAYTTLAREYNLTVVGVSNVGWIKAGVWEGRKCIGRSLAVGPEGDILKIAPYGVNSEKLSIIKI